MKKIYFSLGIGVLLSVGLATTVYAKQHLCPSPQSILDTVNDKSLVQTGLERDRILSYSSSFGTSENWVLIYTYGGGYTPDLIWKYFRNGFAKVPNTPRYAVDEGEYWQCDYDPERYSPQEWDYQTGIVILKDSSSNHICPSASAIKKRVSVSNMQYAYQASTPLSPGYNYGTLDTFDSFGTNEHWQLHYKVLHINSLNEGKNLYQNYIGHFKDENLYAKDEGTKWTCYYNTDFEDYNSPNNSGWDIHDKHWHIFYLTLKSE
jgi:hypothetical protein